MLGATVRHSVSPWAIGGVVKQRHPHHDRLWAIQARDGHVYWLDECQFRTESAGLFSNMERIYNE